MNNDIQEIINKLNEKTIKKQKVYHSSFSKHNEFDKQNTFTKFDFKKYGGFHSACHIEGDNSGKEIAENRVFVKILEDANKMVGLSQELKNEIIKERSVDFEKLKDETGYEVKGEYKNPIMIEAVVSYRKAVYLDENRTGKWDTHDILRELMNKFENGNDEIGITEQEYDDYMEDNLSFNGVGMLELIDESYGGEHIDLEYKEFLFIRDWLESKGYDAIKYNNTYEGNGECIISFRNENIDITNSYCLKEHLNLPKEKKSSKIKNKI